MSEEGEAIIIYTMRAQSGAYVQICNLGATITSAVMPDRDGKLGDVVLGYPNLEQMMRDSAAAGRTVGRVANRIAEGRMTIDGKEYSLEMNNGYNHLHGGVKGFSSQLWESRVETNRVVMSLTSVDGDQGYPGNLQVEVAFDFDDDHDLAISYYALSDATTVVNLTNHAYFNLSAGAQPTVLNHELTLHASHVLEMNDMQIPTGVVLDVEGSAMDFRSARVLGEGIDADFNHLREFRGYDHFFVSDDYQPNILAPIALLHDKQSGRELKVSSSYPGLMVYTGNYLDVASPITKSGERFNRYEGVALECQVHPNAVNEPSFPSVVLEAGERYCQKILFSFSVES